MNYGNKLYKYTNTHYTNIHTQIQIYTNTKHVIVPFHLIDGHTKHTSWAKQGSSIYKVPSKQQGSILLPHWIYWISEIEYMIFIRRCQDWQIMLRCWISICSVSFFRQNCTQCTPLAIFNQFWFTANISILAGRSYGHSSKALSVWYVCYWRL